MFTTPEILYNMHGELQSKLHQLPQETHKQNLAEKFIFEKPDELMPSRKTNTHLENHFYHFKKFAWLIF